MDIDVINFYDGENVESLIELLEQELIKRNWKPADLARAAGLKDATVSRVLNRHASAGPDTCLALAKALGEPPEKIFRLAGILPPLPASEDDKSIGEIMEPFKRLDFSRRKDVLQYALWRFQQQERGEDNGQGDQNDQGPDTLGNAAPSKA